MNKIFFIIFFLSFFSTSFTGAEASSKNKKSFHLKSFLSNRYFLLGFGGFLWVSFLRYASSVEFKDPRIDEDEKIENPDVIKDNLVKKEENNTNNTEDRVFEPISTNNNTEKQLSSFYGSQSTQTTHVKKNFNISGHTQDSTIPENYEQNIMQNPRELTIENNNDKTPTNKKNIGFKSAFSINSPPVSDTNKTENKNLEEYNEECGVLKKYSNYKPLWESFDEFENQLKNKKITDQQRTQQIEARKKQENAEIVNILSDFLTIPAWQYNEDYEELLRLCGPKKRWMPLLFDALPYQHVLFMLYEGRINQIIAVIKHIKGSFLGEYYLHNLINFKCNTGNFTKNEFVGKTFAEIIKGIYEITSNNSSFKEIINYKNHIYSQFYEIKDPEDDFVDEQYGMYKNSLVQLKKLTEEHLNIVKNIESIKKYVKEKKTWYEVGFDTHSITPFQWNLIISDYSPKEIGDWCKNDACLLQKLKDSKTPTITSILQTIVRFEKDVGKNVDFSKIYAFFDYLSKNCLPELIVTFDYSNACKSSSASRKSRYDVGYFNFPLEYITEITKTTFPESLKTTLQEIFIITNNEMHFLFVSIKNNENYEQLVASIFINIENFNENYKQLVVSIIKYLPKLFFEEVTKVRIKQSEYQTLPKNLLDNFVLPLGDYLTRDEIFYFNNQLVSYISQQKFNFYNIILLLDVYKNRQYLTLDECKSEIKDLFEAIRKKMMEKNLDCLYFFLEYIQKILNSSEIDAFLIDSIKENIEVFLPSIFSTLLENTKVENITTLYDQHAIFNFFSDHSLLYLENPKIKKIWEEQWKEIVDIIGFQSNNINNFTKCHCEIRQELKNQPNLLVLKSLLWSRQNTFDKQKLFLSYCLEKKAFELVVFILEQIKEDNHELYKQLIASVKFELCSALFQGNKKNKVLILILNKYMEEFLEEDCVNANKYVESDVAKHFIDSLINAKNNTKISAIIANAWSLESKQINYCKEHKYKKWYMSYKNKTSKLFFRYMSPQVLEYAMEQFSQLKQSDFLSNSFSYNYESRGGDRINKGVTYAIINEDLTEAIKYIAQVQFDRNMYHKKK